ncbi:Uncharacterised protein [Legionella lansingensis]|uniref:Uncharacterized protein n=1 Tax=Legionella lansingensis TaxID=45067 RepID=A0A0W0VJ30_9GAMM|nr:hypothetical protein [Legionella lansingensis]KTD20104.1 hypothetical protein Llan_2033 [Legionella lansingensis]SNV51133.1 Uncharacterised protein [Legionella lansingensis]
MNAWNSVIFMKTSKPWSELSSMAKWPGVEKMWSTTGKWDWCIKLDKNSSTPEKTHEFVTRMRDGHWATETQTNWWKEISAK